ncbi:Nif3-like dinuclear metal center hexameric protein [Acidaminococcus sp. NSJ-142]|uniref:Nif3-like dinuclear metal center hexameric protein n=1 Tax=Acidaminococcus TaxID=904 RepID=UPI000CF8671C|nr:MULTISPECIES: Nif3-like dinuclear metal center hexameric protein [Acidaminococcus]MCD2434732.1 Nif3-like dinuclear metal center hexameric protein [Acidaminococcus hominis]MCH4095369.1 Nif3-like dinuclear metal center hexameric protein [Acidaminococcus provencensis]RHK03340.1 Nif3-like dinuclear metal center hexameric protein [Acidaminococcus sp. AM05-11]
METTVTDICILMNELAPVHYAESWDNPGLLLGHLPAPVHKILVALDLMPEVAEQAIEEEVDLIITHHPFYFHLPKTLAVTDTKMEVLYELIKHDIAVYAAHTNLDAAKGGVNDVLAAKLGLEDVQEIPRKDCPEQGLARIGVLPQPMELADFVALVRDNLGAEHLTFAGGDEPVFKVAVVGGSGSDFMEDALAAGADTLVTGDVKYHVAQKAVNLGLNIVDGTHQLTEMPVIDALEERLKAWGAENDRHFEVIRAHEDRLLQNV